MATLANILTSGILEVKGKDRDSRQQLALYLLLFCCASLLSIDLEDKTSSSRAAKDTRRGGTSPRHSHTRRLSCHHGAPNDEAFLPSLVTSCASGWTFVYLIYIGLFRYVVIKQKSGIWSWRLVLGAGSGQCARSLAECFRDVSCELLLFESKHLLTSTDLSRFSLVLFFPLQTATTTKNRFEKLRPTLPKDLDVVGVGGWYKLQTLANDDASAPKEKLVNWIFDQNKQDKDQSADDGTLLGLVALLEAEGKGYDSDLIDGEWRAVLSKSTKKSPKVQKVFDSNTAAGSFSNFHVDESRFEGDVRVLKYGHLKSFVKFKPLSENFDIGPDGSVVLRRISCDITGASWKFWKLPTLPLPLKRKGGYLDVLYLDKDLRITKGNRGGLFVHARPTFWEQQQEMHVEFDTR
jgi:hypothetical protein